MVYLRHRSFFQTSLWVFNWNFLAKSIKKLLKNTDKKNQTFFAGVSRIIGCNRCDLNYLNLRGRYESERSGFAESISEDLWLINIMRGKLHGGGFVWFRELTAYTLTLIALFLLWIFLTCHHLRTLMRSLAIKKLYFRNQTIFFSFPKSTNDVAFIANSTMLVDTGKKEKNVTISIKFLNNLPLLKHIVIFLYFPQHINRIIIEMHNTSRNTSTF